MDADRQVEKHWTDEQKKALAAKLRAHEDIYTDLGPSAVEPERKRPKQPYDPDPEMTINPRTKRKNFGSI